MKILITGLLCFGIWATVTTYWYLCPTEQSNKDVALNIPPKKGVEKADTEKDEKSLEENNLNLKMAVVNDTIKTEESTNNKFFYGKTLVYYFDFNTENVSQSLTNNSEFVELIQHLKESQEVKINLTGHTVNIGPDEENYKLGMHRAKSVANIFETESIINTRIKIISKGETSPISENDSETGRAKNRRIEIVLFN